MGRPTPDLIAKLGKTYSDVLPEVSKKLILEKIENFETKINTTVIIKKTEEELDVIYNDFVVEWNDFIKTLNDILFDFNLTTSEATFIHNELCNKMAYSISDDSLLLADRLYTEWLYKLADNKKSDNKVKEGNYQITCAQSVSLLTLLNTVVIIGIGDKFRTLLEIVKKAGGISIAYNPYHTKSEDLSLRVQDLFAGLIKSADAEEESEKESIFEECVDESEENTALAETMSEYTEDANFDSKTGEITINGKKSEAYSKTIIMPTEE